MALSAVAKRYNAGQSLIEVLIAITVVTVVLITLVSAIVMAIRGVRFSKEKIKATFLVQEGMEWARGQRSSLGWADFVDQANASGARYCLVNLDFSLVGACNQSQLVASIFIRELVLTNLGNNTVKVNVKVSWDEGGKVFASEVETTLTKWEAQ